MQSFIHFFFQEDIGVSASLIDMADPFFPAVRRGDSTQVTAGTAVSGVNIPQKFYLLTQKSNFREIPHFVLNFILFVKFWDSVPIFHVTGIIGP